MSGLFGSNLTLWIGLGGIGLALVIVACLFLFPGPPRVSLDRRRPVRERTGSGLSRVTGAVTHSIEEVLLKRDSKLGDRLELAGMKISPSEYLIYLGGALLGGLALGLLMRSPLLVVLVLILVPSAGVLILRIGAGRRRAAFAKQLDETAQMLAGSLRSGYSFTQAMTVVAKEADEPTAEEFTRLTNELRVGRPFNDAMQTAAQRMRNEDFLWISQAVSINREVGGNLAEVLDGVSQTIRERAELKREVATLSAEGRLSAYILMALPFLVGGYISFANPEYASRLTGSTLGWLMLGAGAFMMVIGGLWLRAIVRIKY